MAIQDILPFFQLAGQLALITGAGFAAYQLWVLERNRREQADLATLNSFNTNEFRHAFARINTLPLDATPEQVEKVGEDAATTVLMTFEMLGVLVYSKRLSIHTLNEAIGGFMRESWRRLEKWVGAKRLEIRSPRFGEWYQWLFEHLAVNPRRDRGAYEEFRAWKP